MRYKNTIITALLVLMGLTGLGMLLYPTVADWWNSFHQSHAVSDYAAAVAEMDTTRYDTIFAEAEEYNRRLRDSGALWNMSAEEKAEYASILDVNGSGVMGYIDIPKIGVTLPLYHGTSDAVLQVAIGHIAGTSLPIGGTGTHCSVSGHRGLPSARLFTDLDKLAVGDTWTATVLDRTVTYEVDQIRIVLPTVLEDLAIDPERDYFTLITCTPYGINSHRLLVRGHRIDNEKGAVIVLAEAVLVRPEYFALLVGVPLLTLLFFWSLADADRSARYRKASRTAAAELQDRISRRRALAGTEGEDSVRFENRMKGD